MLVVGLLALAAGGVQASPIILTSYDVGNGEQSSFTALQAISRSDSNTPTFTEFVIPYSGVQSASVAGILTRNQYVLTDSSLSVLFAEHSRSRAGTNVTHGAYVFKTDASGVFALSGNYKGHGDSAFDMVLDVRLDDITSGNRLFESVQGAVGISIDLILGEQSGNRISTLNGNLVNTLLDDHIYRLSYFAIMGDMAPGALPATAWGAINFNKVPEPTTLILLILAIALMAFTSRRIG
jgi:hypothetical protein